MKKRTLTLLLVTLFLDVLGGAMLLPLIPALLVDADSLYFILDGSSKDTTLLLVGLIAAIYGCVQFLAAPTLGDLSDNYGRKKILSIGVLILAFSNIIFAVSITLKSIVLLIASRVVAGAAGANFAVAQAIVSDTTLPEKRAKYFGYIGSALSAGLIVGPLLASAVTSFTHNPSLPFMLVGFLGIINFILIRILLTETVISVVVNRNRFSFTRSFSAITQALKSSSLRGLYLALTFQRVGFVFFTTFLAVFINQKFDFTEAKIGIFFAVVGSLMVCTQVFLVGLVSKRYPDKSIINFAVTMLAMVLFLFSHIASVSSLYLLMVPLTISVALINASFPSLISQRASDNHQGVVLGINGSIHAFSQGLAPLLAGFLVAVYGLDTVFSVGGVFILLSLIMIRITK